MTTHVCACRTYWNAGVTGIRQGSWVLLSVLCIVLQASAGIFALGESSIQAEAEHHFEFHLSEKAALLHFVDKVSAWSRYGNAKHIDFKSLSIPEPNSADWDQLNRYAAARKRLGIGYETDLFLWAEQDFPMKGKPRDYAELKAVMDYFQSKPEYRKPLANRMRKLESLKPSVAEELSKLQADLRRFRGITHVFLQGDSFCWKNVPIFLFYTLGSDIGGGANGNGMFGEVDPNGSQAEIRRDCIVLVHESLHHFLSPGECFLQYTADRKETTWHEKLKARANEDTDYEARTLDEILVYTLTDVMLEGIKPEDEVKAARQENNMEYVRIYDGVRLLQPIIQRQIDNPQSRDQFLDELIGAFLAKVHFSVWKDPGSKHAGI